MGRYHRTSPHPNFFLLFFPTIYSLRLCYINIPQPKCLPTPFHATNYCPNLPSPAYFIAYRSHLFPPSNPLRNIHQFADFDFVTKNLHRAPNLLNSAIFALNFELAYFLYICSVYAFYMQFRLILGTMGKNPTPALCFRCKNAYKARYALY